MDGGRNGTEPCLGWGLTLRILHQMNYDDNQIGCLNCIGLLLG